MKIAIIGYSGAGKSILAKKLSEYYSCETLHLDSIHFASDWIERPDEEMIAEVKLFLENESWILWDGRSRRVKKDIAILW